MSTGFSEFGCFMSVLKKIMTISTNIDNTGSGEIAHSINSFPDEQADLSLSPQSP